jgi:AraC-like DNA-binding protein
MTVRPLRTQNFSAELLWEQLGAASFEAMLQAMPDIRFFLKDCRGVYIYASRPMYLAHGFSEPQGVVGHADHDFIPRYLADRYVADDREVLHGSALTGRVELVTRHRGCPDWYITSKTALRGRDGNILGLIGVSRELREGASLAGAFASLAPAVEYIRGHYTDSLELDFLARLSKLSLRTFQRHFKTMFQVAPMEYVRQFRVGKACQLLADTDDTITTIAAATGFCDHSHMNREFARYIGTSPGAYRRRYREP